MRKIKQNKKQTLHGQQQSSHLSDLSENQIYQKQLIAEQSKLSELYQQYHNHPDLMVYKKIKFKQNIFEEGEFVHLFGKDDESPYIAKISKIICLPSQAKIQPFLEVQWLIRKTDLPSKKKITKYFPHMSIAQVFLTNHLEYVRIQSIRNKCFVLPIQQYENLASTADHIHFYRAEFDVQTEELMPDPEQWKTQCICYMPVNPDVQYVQCQLCDKWFHLACVQFQKKKALQKEYNCLQCKEKKKIRKR